MSFVYLQLRDRPPLEDRLAFGIQIVNNLPVVFRSLFPVMNGRGISLMCQALWQSDLPLHLQGRRQDMRRERLNLEPDALYGLKATAERHPNERGTSIPTQERLTRSVCASSPEPATRTEPAAEPSGH